MKINIKTGKRWIISLCCMFLCFHITTLSAQESIYGDFPYVQSFFSANQPLECSKPIPFSGTNAAKFTNAGLQLTEAVQNQFGSVFINDKKFKSHNGIKVEFEYMFYGGTSGDGMTVFFFDADVKQPSIGATGGGMGYTYNRASTANNANRGPGLVGAYLGIGFDSYGNFKRKAWGDKERRNGIDANLRGNEITLRGAKGVPFMYNGKVVPGMEDGYTGYPVLTTASTYYADKMTLQDNGTYAKETRTTGGAFFIAGGATGYRKAFIEIYPHPTDGFYITVKIQWTAAVTSTIIDNYHYKTSFKYQENAMPGSLTSGDGSTSIGATQTVTLNAAIPKFLKVGFAAATGSSTNIHLIKNVVITLPSSAEANPDFATTDNYTPISFSPLTNDIAYKGAISKDQVGNSAHIDPASFRFILADGTVVTSNTYTAAEGTWQYDYTKGQVTFIPKTTFTGKAVINYDIRGKEGDPYVDKAYRSLPSTITVTVTQGNGTPTPPPPPPPPLPGTSSYILSNRMVSPIIK